MIPPVVLVNTNLCRVGWFAYSKRLIPLVMLRPNVRVIVFLIFGPSTLTYGFTERCRALLDRFLELRGLFVFLFVAEDAVQMGWRMDVLLSEESSASKDAEWRRCPTWVVCDRRDFWWSRCSLFALYVPELHWILCATISPLFLWSEPGVVAAIETVCIACFLLAAVASLRWDDRTGGHWNMGHKTSLA